MQLLRAGGAYVEKIIHARRQPDHLNYGGTGPDNPCIHHTLELYVLEKNEVQKVREQERKKEKRKKKGKKKQREKEKERKEEKRKKGGDERKESKKIGKRKEGKK